MPGQADPKQLHTNDGQTDTEFPKCNCNFHSIDKQNAVKGAFK